jgi:transcriptional regulator with XRE-family HTH domain
MKIMEFLRRRQGMSQDELAKNLLYGRTTICRLERGELSGAAVHPRLRRSLEFFFGSPISTLLSDVPDITANICQPLATQGSREGFRALTEKEDRGES